MFKRTEGISTTDIIGRLLMVSQDRGRKTSIDGDIITSSELLKKVQTEKDLLDQGPVVSSFLTTGWRLQEFCNNRIPTENDFVVYIDGAFDILHIGHIETLKKAKELGTFLYVGVHDDMTINKNRGKNYPILNLQERVFNLLALKYVDDVVVGAPWSMTEDLIKSLKINLVVQGTHTKLDEDSGFPTTGDAYEAPKKLGIYKEIISIHELNSDVLVKRLLENRENYLKKYQNKIIKEKVYYENKEFVSEI